MKRITALCLLACAPAATFAGCKPQQSRQDAPGKKLRLAFVTNNASDFWTIARRGTEKATQGLPDVEVDFRIPGEGTAAEQKRPVDDLLARGVDGMAISPVDPRTRRRCSTTRPSRYSC
jgi:ribose transport system substrate-binding protein